MYQERPLTTNGTDVLPARFTSMDSLRCCWDFEYTVAYYDTGKLQSEHIKFDLMFVDHWDIRKIIPSCC